MNLHDLFTRYSTWVVGILMAAATYWLSLSPEEQKALTDAYPWLLKLTPAAGFVAFLIARGLPQTPKDPPSNGESGRASVSLLVALAVAGSLILSGCAQVGAPKPESFNQKALAAHATIEGIAKSALTLREAGKLSDADRDNIVATLRNAQAGIDLATTIAKGNPTAGMSKLDASIAVLTALNAYLASQGAK